MNYLPTIYTHKYIYILLKSEQTKIVRNKISNKIKCNGRIEIKLKINLNSLILIVFV